ncbi:MAG: hypothetical protein ACRDRW_04110 [Pseudonocardiaceae bacterium]
MTSHEGSDDRARDVEPLPDEEPISEEEFAEEVRALVNEDALRVFALVEEYGERDNAGGIAFDNHVEVIHASGGLRVTFHSAEHAQRNYSRRRKIRLVWANPVPPRRPEPVS